MTAPTLPPLPQRTARREELPAIVRILQTQQRQTIDLVSSVSNLSAVGGELAVTGLDPILSEDGVLDANGRYSFTTNAEGQIGSTFGIPVKYTRLLRSTNTELFDENINSWAQHADYADKKVLVRLLWGLDPQNPDAVGVARAVLSDKFGVGTYDNLPITLAVLDGIREGGLRADQVQITGDLSEDRLHLTVDAPEIQGYGWKLLEGYRSPYGNGSGTGHGGSDAENLPIISAGLLIQNSETGLGAAKITPRLKVRACSNGLQVTQDALRQVHVGARLAEGEVQWSDDTRAAANQLARKQAADAVRSFLNATYVQKVVDRLEAEADAPVKDVVKTLEVVSKEQGYTEAEASSILDFFIDGGQRTAGGVLQAVTAAVQQIDDADRAFDIEAGAIDAMRIAARVAREAVAV
jgi:hypothetical protein